jgi:Fic family protein
MKSFDSDLLQRQFIPPHVVLTIGNIRESKGRAALYKEQQPQALQTLQQRAMIQSTESSNRIEGITAPIERIKALVEDKTTPQNRSEQEIIGYRNVLNTIHANYDDIPFTPNIIRQFHRDMLKHIPDAGNWKGIDNSISERLPDGTETIRFQPTPAYQTAEAMLKLHEHFARQWQSGQIDRLVLIPAYVLDFLCIHPFRDGNGRMARLLSLLLLYQAGYDVGRYISLERLIENSKERYYATLHQSSQGWYEGAHSLLPWTDYFLGIVMAAYQEMEEGVGGLLTARGSKSDMVVQAIYSFFGEFSIKDIQHACPHVSIDLIRAILKQEKAKGSIVSLGRGPHAKWKVRE